MEANINIEVLECKEFTQKLREDSLKKEILKLTHDIELLHSFLDVKDITIKNLKERLGEFENGLSE
jgi:hypothetical protein